MFTVSKADLSVSSLLLDFKEKVLEMRLGFLVEFSKDFSKLQQFVDFNDRDNEGSISYHSFRNKNLVLADVLNQLVDKVLESISSCSGNEIKVNRRKAFEFREAGNIDHEGKSSIFGQICTQLKNEHPELRNFRHH